MLGTGTIAGGLSTLLQHSCVLMVWRLLFAIYFSTHDRLRGLKAWVCFSHMCTEIACTHRMWFCGLHNNHITNFGHVLAAISALLLRCSFAATGETIMTAKLSKPMLGDCIINRRLTTTERITNATDFWKPPKSSIVICDTERCFIQCS